MILTKLCNEYSKKPVSRTDLVRELMKHLPHTAEKTKDDDKHLEEVAPAEIIFPPPDEIKKLIHAVKMGSIAYLFRVLR